MTPPTTGAAYAQGYDEGRDFSGMLSRQCAWPTPAMMDKPDALVRAWMRGYRDGTDDMSQRFTPAWANE
jgi:hypothetical protein